MYLGIWDINRENYWDLLLHVSTSWSCFSGKKRSYKQKFKRFFVVVTLQVNLPKLAPSVQCKLQRSSYTQLVRTRKVGETNAMTIA